MNIFAQKNYRQAFLLLFQQEKERKPGWSLQGLAKKCRVQPSYLTNVIKERAHFSSDQIFAIGEHLQLPQAQINFLLDLMEWERADHPPRKKMLAEKIGAARGENLRAEKVLSASAPILLGEQMERYYLDPNIELIHLYLRTEGAPLETAKVARVWGLSVAYMAEILSFLDAAGLAKKTAKGWQVERIHQLLPRSSPLCKPQQALKRSRAAEAMQRIQPEKVYSFSGTVTMNDETRTQMQARFLVFLKECEEMVLTSTRENLYHLQFDLFPWLDR